MGEIYFRDALLPNDYDGLAPRRSVDDMFNLLPEICPIPPKTIKPLKLGFLACYENDQDVNFIYNPDIIQKLRDKELLPRLAYNTAANREVYLLSPSSTIYNKLDAHLITEIEQRNNISLIQLVKFTSNSNQKRYIKLTLDSKIARDSLVAKGTADVFYTSLPAKAKIGGSRQPGIPGDRGGRDATAAAPPITAPHQRSSTTQHPYAPGHQHHAAYAPAPAPGFYSTPSSMHQGRLLSASSSWAGPRTMPSTHSMPMNAPGLLSAPPGLVAHQHQYNEMEVKSFMAASITFAEILTEGRDQPEAILANFNAILQFNGYLPLNVPQELLESAKIIYQNKFQIDHIFHNPSLFHPPHPQPPNPPPPPGHFPPLPKSTHSTPGQPTSATPDQQIQPTPVSLAACSAPAPPPITQTTTDTIATTPTSSVATKVTPSQPDSTPTVTTIQQTTSPPPSVAGPSGQTSPVTTNSTDISQIPMPSSTATAPTQPHNTSPSIMRNLLSLPRSGLPFFSSAFTHPSTTHPNHVPNHIPPQSSSLSPNGSTPVNVHDDENSATSDIPENDLILATRLRQRGGKS